MARQLTEMEIQRFRNQGLSFDEIKAGVHPVTGQALVEILDNEEAKRKQRVKRGWLISIPIIIGLIVGITLCVRHVENTSTIEGLSCDDYYARADVIYYAQPETSAFRLNWTAHRWRMEGYGRVNPETWKYQTDRNWYLDRCV